MSRIHKFRVVPYLPEKLRPLLRIAYNMWWVWNFEAIELFRRLDVEVWREVRHNPVKLLGSVPQETLEDAAESESFLAHMERVEKELDWHMSRKTWYDDNNSDFEDASIAYFSAEYGIHECLTIYSGGLGVLSGDHIKSASELGLPMYGIGLMYRLGYFRQYLTVDGWQQERLPEIDFFNIPVNKVTDKNGTPVYIGVDFPGRTVHAQIWELRVGKIVLYLLDSNIDLNSYEDRTITEQLYGGDIEMRIRQEIMLGIGGFRALRAMGKDISVYHMNEGHAAFLSIERIRSIMKEQGMSYSEACELVTASNVFTTHTPVPAGNDRFEPELMDKYFSHTHEDLGIGRKQFLALGREDPDNDKETFCMTVLALKTSAGCNGVSRLHGRVSRNMWKNIWRDVPPHEIPIGHVTNGIQTLSWTSDEMMRLLNRYLGPRWIDNPTDKGIWKNIDDIPDSELWRCRERLRERLVAYSRKRLREQLGSRGVSRKEVEKASSVLDPEALTIGFARRFATYKRATLILRDIERLNEMLNNRERPMQIIFAGKAHPRDHMGKELIKQIVHLTKDERFRNSIVFLEDYDIDTARYLVQGVDVWLNNPIRPKEASGTSGMKVVPNGGLNISVLDGWWDEAYNSDNGWAIGKGEEYADLGYQDEVESLSLYNILENEVMPSFYDRGIDGLPREWLARIRESMKTINAEFNTNRMVKDYTEKYYRPAHRNYRAFMADGCAIPRQLSRWKADINQKWSGIKVKNCTFEDGNEIVVGNRVQVRAEVDLGELKPEDVLVELYFGSLDRDGNIVEGAAMPMSMAEMSGKNTAIYQGQMLCLIAGEFAFTVRIIPQHEHSYRKFDPEMSVTWASEGKT